MWKQNLDWKGASWTKLPNWFILPRLDNVHYVNYGKQKQFSSHPIIQTLHYSNLPYQFATNQWEQALIRASFFLDNLTNRITKFREKKCHSGCHPKIELFPIAHLEMNTQLKIISHLNDLPQWTRAIWIPWPYSPPTSFLQPILFHNHPPSQDPYLVIIPGAIY